MDAIQKARLELNEICKEPKAEAIEGLEIGTLEHVKLHNRDKLHDLWVRFGHTITHRATGNRFDLSQEEPAEEETTASLASF